MNCVKMCRMFYFPPFHMLSTTMYIVDCSCTVVSPLCYNAFSLAAVCLVSRHVFT